MAIKGGDARQKKVMKKQVAQTEGISDILRGKKPLNGSIKLSESAKANMGDFKDFIKKVDNGFGGLIAKELRPKIKVLEAKDLDKKDSK